MLVGLAGVGAHDHIVIASSHLALKSTGCWWPGARYLVRSGPDGADLALLDLLSRERVADRFRDVTIASGDGIFTQAASVLTAAGCVVTVVSQRARLSGQLAAAIGWKVTYIDPPGACRCQLPARHRPRDTTHPRGEALKEPA